VRVRVGRQEENMRSRLALCLVVSVLAAATVSAITESATRAYVVSVDVKAKSITVRHTVGDTKKWKQTVAFWSDTTEWARCDEHVWDCKPASAELAKQLAKDAKVYVTISDHGDGKIRLERLKTMPPGETID
jgi:hypothetical protein